MKNTEAADVIREYIRTNKPCNGLEAALHKAITALEHQPEPQTIHLVVWDRQRDTYECTVCHETFSNSEWAATHHMTATIQVSEIGRKA